MKPSNWRLILSPPDNGAWNMSVDESIMDAVISRNVPPTLRLFSWQPYCLSIGHAQSYLEVDEVSLTKNGWDLVRRPTGGRAILHADELTYSIVAPLDDPHVHGGVLESYRYFSRCLLNALKEIGIQADSTSKSEDERYLSKDPICFQYPSDYEITFQGKKLVGSAQARKKDSLLQHGAIPLFGNINRIIDVLNFESKEKSLNAKGQLFARATTIEAIIGHRVAWNEFADAMSKAFKHTLKIELIPSALSENEVERAQALQNEKYSNNSWTYRI